MLVSVFSAMSITAFAEETSLDEISISNICVPEDRAPVVDYVIPDEIDAFYIDAIRWYDTSTTGTEYRLYDSDLFFEGNSYRVYVDIKLKEGYITQFRGFEARINGEYCQWTDMHDYSVTLYQDYTATAAKRHTYGEWQEVSEAGIGSDGIKYRFAEDDPNYFELSRVYGFYGDIEFPNAEWSDDAFYYTGKVITPIITVRDGGEYILTKGTDYTLSYSSGRKNVGTYKVTVKFINKISGSKTFTFRIVKAKQKLSVKAVTKTVKYSAVKKKNVTVAPLAVKNAQGKVSYKKLSGNSKITVNTSNGKFTVKKGLKKGTYKVKVKVKAAGNSNYNSGAQTVTATVKVV